MAMVFTSLAIVVTAFRIEAARVCIELHRHQPGAKQHEDQSVSHDAAGSLSWLSLSIGVLAAFGSGTFGNDSYHCVTLLAISDI
jgi:hypothetical protein